MGSVAPRSTAVTGDCHRHRGSRIDNSRELVPGELSPSAGVGRIHGRQPARFRKIPSAESDVMRPEWGKSTAGELRRFLITGEDLRMRRGADDSWRTPGIWDARRAIDEDEKREGNPAKPPPVSARFRTHTTMIACLRCDRGLPRPCDCVRLARKKRTEMRFLEPSEVDALAAAMDPRYRTAVLLAAYGGLRAGELFGLRGQVRRSAATKPRDRRDSRRCRRPPRR